MARPAQVIKRIGGKRQLAPAIVELLPPSEIYIEPFFGGGSVFFLRRRSRFEVINDIDGRVANFFRVLRDNGDALRRRCEDTEYSEAVFAECAEPSDDPFIDAWRFYVRNRMSVFGTGRCFSYSWASAAPATFMTATSNIDRYRDLLRRAHIFNRPAENVLREFCSEQSVAYLDPPYVRDATGKRRGAYYKNEMSDSDHARLLDLIDGLPGRFAVSAYDNPIYSERLRAPKWRRVSFGSVLSKLALGSAALAGKEGGFERDETLYLNYPPPVVRDAFARDAVE